MLEHSRPTRCTVSELVMGNEYRFRVYSENVCGTSQEPATSHNTARIAKEGPLWGHTGSYGVIWGRSEPFGVIRGHMGSREVS